MGFIKKTKETLKQETENIKSNKKVALDQKEIRKRIEEVNKKHIEEIKKYKKSDISNTPTDKNYQAIVRLVISSGTNLEEIAELGATIGYKEGKQTLKVVNKDNEVIFEEYKPDWQNKFRFLDKDTIEKKIKEIKDELKKFQTGEQKYKKDKRTGQIYYEEDYLAMLREKEQELAIITLGDKGSYSTTKDGIHIYTFEVIGFFKIPLYYYTDKSILGLPPATKITVGQYIVEMLFRNYKANETRAERIMISIIAVLLGIALIGAVYTIYHSAGMVEQTALTVKDTGSTINSLMNISDKFEQLINNTHITNQILMSEHALVTQNISSVIN